MTAAHATQAVQAMPGRYRFRHVARMEWVKLRTLRSVRWTLLFALAGMIGIGVAAGFNTRNPKGDVTNNILAGGALGSVLFAVLGVLVSRVAAGGTALDREVVSQLLAASRHAGDLDPLTPREHDVLALMAEGRSNAGVATALVLTLGTVEKHVASIFGKLGLPACQTDNRRVLAVLRYLGC
jgi:DNA-binding NarL/FixJ family response regulator